METKRTEIVIIDYKDTSASRTTFETRDHGKMSAFKNEGESLIDLLKSHVNKLISVQVSKTEKEGTTFYNIRKFNGIITEQETSPLDSIPVEKPLMKEIPENYTLRKSVKGSAYEKDPVGLAVEIYSTRLALSMDECITEVKRAQKAFS